MNPQTNYYCQLHHASSFESKATKIIKLKSAGGGWGGGGGGGGDYTSAGDFNNYFEAVELLAR